MFRLEKVFQNDDSGYILFSIFIKSLLLLLFSYIFVILSNHTIYELNDYKIFIKSNYFLAERRPKSTFPASARTSPAKGVPS